MNLSDANIVARRPLRIRTILRGPIGGDQGKQMHQKMIGLVEAATQQADNPQLRMLLEQSRPALQDHLEQAQNVKRALVASR